MLVERLSKRALQKIIGGRVKEPATCVVKFYSNRCHYCRDLKDLFEDVAEEYNEVLFFAFNIKDYPQIQKIMKFNGVPTISMIKVGTTTPRIRLMKEPEEPDKKTWYKVNDIRQFIEGEQA